MPIPDYQTVMLPLLRLLGDQKEHSLPSVIDALGGEFQLSDEERNRLLPSGNQAVFRNRVGWARTYLKKAGLLEYPRRGFLAITPRGVHVLSKGPGRIDVKFLEQFAEFVEFKTTRKEKASVAGDDDDDSTPEEALEAAYAKIRASLENELLQQVKSSSPEFFERLVVDLLVKMGYGGSRSDAGRSVGRSGDGGVDGIIKEDRLGLDAIYLQAKRWGEATVGRPDIQKFAGALQGQRAKKGVFITTSTFSNDALEYAERIDSKIVLIDGLTLAGLMIDHDVGVTLAGAYQIKRLDLDYFTGE
jgi:restriction system protein